MKFNNGDVLVQKGKHFPDSAVVVDGYDATGRLLVHPLGGGFQIAFAANAVSRFRLVDEDERERAMFRRAKFSLMDSEEHFTGLTNGECWNGWATPHFEFNEARRLIAWLKNDKARFDAAGDAFITAPADGEEEIWKGKSVAVADGTSAKAYPIGAGSWCWDEVED